MTLLLVQVQDTHSTLFIWDLDNHNLTWKFDIRLEQEGATYGPRRLHFELSKYIIDLNLARETQIKAQRAPWTKIVARPWARTNFCRYPKNGQK